jgi:hypothetical protein
MSTDKFVAMIGVGQNRFLTGWNQADDNHPLSEAWLRSCLWTPRKGKFEL